MVNIVHSGRHATAMEEHNHKLVLGLAGRRNPMKSDFHLVLPTRLPAQIRRG